MILHDHICKLPSCGKAFKHKDRFRVGCCKEHALAFNRLTVKHGKRPLNTKKVGRATMKAGYAGAGAVDVCSVSPRRFA